MNKYTTCPRCFDEGRDKKGNNLVVYPDGWEICYAGHGVLSRGEPNSMSFFHRSPVLVFSSDSFTEVVSGVTDIHSPDVLKFLWQYGLKYYEHFGVKQISEGYITRSSGGEVLSEHYVELGMIIPCEGTSFDNFSIRRIGVHEGEKKSFGSKGSRHFEAIYPHTDLLVIVEDCFSAMKIHQAGFSALALLGTNLKLETKARIYGLTQTHPNIIVWLDGDVAGFKGSAKVIKELGWAVNKIACISTPKDPKWFGECYIQERIKYVWS